MFSYQPETSAPTHGFASQSQPRLALIESPKCRECIVGRILAKWLHGLSNLILRDIFAARRAPRSALPTAAGQRGIWRDKSVLRFHRPTTGAVAQQHDPWSGVTTVAVMPAPRRSEPITGRAVGAITSCRVIGGVGSPHHSILGRNRCAAKQSRL